uniref:Uncharacterized protein n=1 Tax=Arcella intermedia TaxID=1963864 RepID=A0A6B2LPU2_9EUKA
MIDKPESSTWKSLIEEEQNLTAIIYFVATDEYDVIDEGTGECKIEMSRSKLKEIVCSGVINEKTRIVVFLNRKDLFQERMKDPNGFEAFKQRFPEYRGGPDEVEGLDFLRDWFKSVTDRRINVHYTSAFDNERYMKV